MKTCNGCGRSDGEHPKHCPNYQALTSDTPNRDRLRSVLRDMEMLLSDANFNPGLLAWHEQYRSKRAELMEFLED